MNPTKICSDHNYPGREVPNNAPSIPFPDKLIEVMLEHGPTESNCRALLGGPTESNFEYTINQSCDVITDLTITGDVVSAQFVAGGKKNQTIIEIPKTIDSSHGIFYSPQPPFPLFLVPFQRLKVVVKGMGKIKLQYMERFVSFSEREKTRAVLSWNSERYIFENGVIRRG